MGDPEEIRVGHAVSAANEPLVREQFQSLTRLVPVLYGTIAADTILLAWILRDWIPIWANIPATAIMVSLIAVRIAHWVRLRGTAHVLDMPRIRRAIRGTAIIGPLVAFGYAVIGFLWMRQEGTGLLQTLNLMSIWILASACSFCLFSLPVTAILILVLACVPLCLALALSGDSQLLLELPAFVTISALMIYVLRENFKIFKEIVDSRTKMKALQQHLARAQRVGLVGSADVDLRTGAELWSDQLFALLGLDPVAVRPGLDAYVAAVHPDDRDMVRDATTRNRRGVNVAPMEFRVPRADGSVRWLAWASELVLSDKGIPEEVITTVHDITERKRAEAQNRELLLQLSQAQKMEAVGHLTGGIAHDFNNLLAVILGRLQLLDEELPDKPELQDWVRSSIKAVDRGATLTRSLVAFSRRQTLAPIELDPNAVIDDIESMLRQTLGKAHELRMTKAPEPWHVEADPGQLHSALLNLVLNARDAMLKDGAVTVATANATLDAEYVRGHSELRAGDYVMLTVSDTGIGMSHEVAQRAFEPFFTTKDVGKGSGLGLSMVYGFVKQSGGHVTIESEPGVGTTVRLYLPRKIDGRSVAPAKDVELLSTTLDTATILLVEDNDELRKTTRLQLERLGYAVREAGHGAEGLRVLRETRGIDLLLTDVVMPQGMSGPELAEAATALLPHLKVIFMSGHSELHDMLQPGRRPGPLRLLQKPFYLDELETQIRATLD